MGKNGKVYHERYGYRNPLAWLVFSFVFVLFLFSGSAAENLKQDVSGPGEKSVQYYKILLKRPEAGYVFDRFTNSFLETQTMEQMEEFLVENAKEKGSAARLLLGYYYSNNSNYDKAKEEFGKIISDETASLEIRIKGYFHRGNTNLNLLNFDAAIADYKGALELEHDVKSKLEIAKQLSKAYIRSGKPKEAISLWDEIVAENPDKQDLQEDLIELYIEEELYDEAIKVADTLLEKTSDSYDKVMRMLRKGDIYQFSGKDQKAVEFYSETLALVGKGTWLEREILAQISRVFMREENNTGLEEHLLGLVEKYPARTTLIQKYSQVMAKNSKYNEAIEAYRKVLQLSPGDKDIAWGFVELLNDAKKSDEAVKAMESLAEQHNGDLELRLSLAELYHSVKKTDMAIKTVDSFLADAEKGEYSYSRACNLFEKYGSKEKADETYKKMVTLLAENSAVKEMYALYLSRTERKDEAAAIWKDLAEKGDLDLFIRTCRTLRSKGLADVAFDIMSRRFDEFKSDSVFLSDAVDAASSLKKYDEAVRWAMALTVNALNAGQLENVILKSKDVIKHAKKFEDVIDALEAKQQKKIQESCLLAELYDAAGEYDKAIATLNSAGDQESELLLSQRVRICLQNYQWDEASEAAEKLFASAGGSNSQNAKKLVDIYRKSFNTEKAIHWVNRWKELSHGSTTPWMVHADILYGSAKFNEAIDVLRIAARKFDSNTELLTKLAQYYSSSMKYAEASRIYWELYESSESLGDKLGWVERLATVSEQGGTLNTLIDQFKQRKQQDKMSILPKLALARIYKRSEDYELRRRELIEVSRLKPDDIGVIYEIAKIEELAGRWQDAISTLNKAKELDSTSKTDYKIAQLYVNYGNETQGIKMLLELAGGFDGDAGQAKSLADMLIMQGFAEMAVKYLDEVMIKFLGDWQLKYLRAVAIEEHDPGVGAVEAFLSLLDENEEIKVQTGTQSVYNQHQSQYMLEMKKIIPPQAVDFMMNLNYSHQAYSYRQNRYHYGAMISTAKSSMIQIPQNIEMLRSFSLIHILNLKSYLDEKIGSRVVDRLKASNIANAELLAELSLTANSYLDYDNSILQLIEKYPDHEIPLSLAVCRSRGVSDPNVCLKQIKLFKDKYPILAAIAGISLYTISEEKDEKILDESFKILEDFEKPTGMCLQLLMQSFQRQMQADLEENKTISKRLYKVLIGWNDKCENSTQSGFSMGDYIFKTIVSLTIQGGDYEGLADLINNEMKKYKRSISNSSVPSAQTVHIGTQNVGVMRASIPFPPKQLPGYPYYLLELAGGNINNFYSMRQTGFDIEELAKITDKIEDKLLRVYIYNATDKTEEAKKLFNELAAESPKDPAVVMYKAAKAFDEEDYHSAVIMMDQMRQETANHMQRQSYDQLLVSGAVAFLGLSAEQRDKSCDKDQQDKIKELGQKAALRLRKGSVSGSQRRELAEAMRRLGLEKQAKEIDEKIAATAQNPPQYFPSGFPASYNSSQVEKLFTEGKKEEAIKHIRKFLENTAKNELLTNGRNSSYEIRRAKEMLQKKLLCEEVAELCKPKDDSSAQSWQVYAKVCEYLDQNEQMRDAWAKVLAIKPNDAMANLYTAMFCVENDPNKADEHISKINKNHIGMIAMKLGEMSDNSQDDYKRRFVAWRLANVLLRHPGIDERTDLNYLCRMLRRMEGSIYVRKPNDDFNVNGLFSKPEKLSPEAQKIWDEREAIYSAFSKSLLEKPTACDQAFISLVKFARARGTYDPNEIVALAQDVLDGYRFVNSSINYTFSTNENVATGVCEILLEEAGKEGKITEKAEQIAEVLRSHRGLDIAKQVKDFAMLYTADANEWPEAAAKYMKYYGNNTRHIISDYGPFKQIIMTGLKRKELDMSGFICDSLKKSTTNIQHNDLSLAANCILKNNGAEEAEKFVEMVATSLTCPTEKRKEYCEKNYNPHMGYSSGTPNYKVYIYYNFLSELSNKSDPELIKIVFDHLKYIPLTHTGRINNISYRVAEIVTDNNYDKAANFLVKAGLTGDPNQIRFVHMHRDNENYLTINSYIMGRLKNSSSYKDNFKKTLEKCPESFGRKLLGGILDNKMDVVADALLENFGTIKKLSPEKQNDLTSFIRETTGLMSGFKEDQKYAELNEWYAKIAGSSGKKELEEFLNIPASKLFTQDMYDHRYFELVSTVAKTVIHDPNSFDRLMDHADKIYKKGIIIRNFQKISGSYRDHFIEKFINNSSNRSPGVLKFYVEMARKKGSSLSRLESYRISESFSGYISGNEKALRSGDKKALSGLVDYAGQIFGKGNASFGAPTQALYNRGLLYYNKPEQYAGILKTLEELKDESEYPNIVDELIVAVKARLRNVEKDKDKKQALLEEVQGYYKAVLADKELSEIWRFGIYSRLRNDWDPVRNSEEITWLIMDEAIDYMQAGHGQYYPVYRVFNDVLDNYLKLEHTERWKETANRFADVFFNQWTKMKNSSHRYGSDVNFIFKCVQLHFEANGGERPEVIDRIAKMSDDSMYKIPETVALMVHYGLEDKARSTFSNNIDNLSSQDIRILKMTAELGAKSDAFIKSFDNPKDQLYAKVAMWMRQDDKEAIDANSLKLNEKARYTQIARDYIEVVAFKNREKDPLLERLLEKDYLNPMLKDGVYKLCQGRDFLAQMMQNDQSLENFNKKLASTYFMMCFEDGNSQPFIDTVNKMPDYLTNSNRYRYEITAWLGNWHRQFESRLLKKSELSEKFVASVADGYKSIFETFLKLDRQYRDDMSFYEFVRVYSLVSIAGGKMDEFFDCLNSFDEKEIARIRGYLTINSMFSYYGQWAGKYTVSPEVFNKSVQSIANSEFFAESMKSQKIGEISGIYPYLDRRVHFKAEYLAKCIDYAKDNIKPFDAAYLYSKAKDMDNCIAMCDKGIAEAKNDMEKANMILDKAGYCKKLKPEVFEECKEDLESLKDKLDKKTMGRYNQMFAVRTKKKAG